MKQNENSIKQEVEQDVINLLKKYDIIPNDTVAIKHVEIVCDVEDMPIVKLEGIVVDRKKNKVTLKKMLGDEI